MLNRITDYIDTIDDTPFWDYYNQYVVFTLENNIITESQRKYTNDTLYKIDMELNRIFGGVIHGFEFAGNTKSLQ